MLEALHSPIAQEYEVPKKPLFVMDDALWLSQSTDIDTYVSDSISENILSVTNGNVGLRCKTENETVEIENEVMLIGAHHKATKGGTQIDVGAVPCTVSIDFLVDGSPGTLSHSPSTRLSLQDGTFHRQCEGIMNSDGSVVFDCDYFHSVSTTDPSVWAAEVSYHNFRAVFSASNSTFSSPVGEECGTSLNADADRFPETFQMACVVTVMIHKQEWSIVRLKQLESIVQRSLTSSCVVSSSIDVQCHVEGGPNPGRLLDMPVSISPGERRHRKSLTRLDINGGPDEFGENTYRDPFDNNVEDENKVFVVKKTFMCVYDECSPFTKVVLNLSASHSLGVEVPVPRSLPSLQAIRETTKQDFEEFLSTCEVQLELEDEPRERTQLALRYNSMRLYFLSRGLVKGIPYRMCGDGEGMLYDLGNYVYHGIYFTLTQPDTALQLLKSVYGMLDKARENARRFALHAGAVYPLRTIEGSECMTVGGSNCFTHVNAELGQLISIYFVIAPDTIPETVRLELLEMMLETARVWLQLGYWIEETNTFHIKSAVGADIYNKSACNNFYSTISAKKHLERAVNVFLAQEKALGPTVMDELLCKIHMSRLEIDQMALTHPRILLESSTQYEGVYPVHNTFDTLHPWVSTKRVSHPLYLNYHPLAVYRRKVVDIPDVLLGMLLYNDCFERTAYRKNIEYYLPLCTFDSPESLGVVAMTHCRAYRNFAKPMHCYRVLSHLNLDNIMYCSEEGLNYASITGSLLTLMLGLGGVTISTGSLRIDPIIPAGLSFYSMCLGWKGARLRLSLNSENIVYELVSGNSVRFLHGPSGHRIHLHTGYRSFKASTTISIPRVTFRQEGVFEGAIVLLEAVVHNILEYHYVSWHRTLERLFDTYRTLHNVVIPPLNPEEFIEKIVYAHEETAPFTGIHNVLRFRNIHLELGTPDDAEIVDTLYGLGNANLAEITELFQQQKPTLNPDILRLLENLSAHEVPMAVVSYTRHLKLLLSMFPELSRLFITTIDGDEVLDAHLRGQPHVDIFQRAAKKIHVHPSRCLVLSHHLDRGYAVNDLAGFFMFLDIDDPFVSSRIAPLPYPLLSPDGVQHYERENPLICRLLLPAIPKDLDDLEDVIQGTN
eukprot:gene7258-5105_t